MPLSCNLAQVDWCAERLEGLPFFYSKKGRASDRRESPRSDARRFLMAPALKKAAHLCPGHLRGDLWLLDAAARQVER
jgi:hypothetical protein